jgi:DNA polymerase-3 subunit delta
MGKKKQVEVEDVMKVISHAKIESVFDLTNAIGRKDRSAALISLVRLLESGQNEVGALLLISRHMHILANIKQGMKQGLSGPRLCAKAGIPNFFLKQYQAQCGLWREDKLNQTFEALHNTYKALKSSPVSSHIWLENFIVQTCSF